MSDASKTEVSLYYKIMADRGIQVDQRDPELLEKAEKHFMRLIAGVNEHGDPLVLGVRDLVIAQIMCSHGGDIHNSNVNTNPK